MIERPEEASRRLVQHLRDRDVNALQDLYEPGAVFADLDGVARGWPAIRSAHEGFLDAGHTLTLVDYVSLEVDDVALVHWSWVVQLGDGATMRGNSAEVLRRQGDGSWKFLIDNSDGSALVGLG